MKSQCFRQNARDYSDLGRKNYCCGPSWGLLRGHRWWGILLLTLFSACGTEVVSDGEKVLLTDPLLDGVQVVSKDQQALLTIVSRVPYPPGEGNHIWPGAAVLLIDGKTAYYGGSLGDSVSVEERPVRVPLLNASRSAALRVPAGQHHIELVPDDTDLPRISTLQRDYLPGRAYTLVLTGDGPGARILPDQPDLLSASQLGERPFVVIAHSGAGSQADLLTRVRGSDASGTFVDRVNPGEVVFDYQEDDQETILRVPVSNWDSTLGFDQRPHVVHSFGSGLWNAARDYPGATYVGMQYILTEEFNDQLCLSEGYTPLTHESPDCTIPRSVARVCYLFDAAYSETHQGFGQGWSAKLPPDGQVRCLRDPSVLTQ